MLVNLQFFLNSYADFLPTTTPSQNNFKWLREINGIPYNLENDQQIQVLPSITTPNIVPYPFSTPTATVAANINSTTIATLTASPANIILGQLIVGTGIPAGSTAVFLAPTQYSFITSPANATSGATYSNNGQTFTVVNTIVAGTTLTATGTGAPSVSGTLTKVTGTGDATIAFSAFTQSTLLTMSLPATLTVATSLSFYSPASFVYLESDQQVSVIYNGGSAVVLNPFKVNGLTQPAVFFMAGPVYSLTINNISATTANVFSASMG